MLQARHDRKKDRKSLARLIENSIAILLPTVCLEKACVYAVKVLEKATIALQIEILGTLFFDK